MGFVANTLFVLSSSKKCTAAALGLFVHYALFIRAFLTIAVLEYITASNQNVVTAAENACLYGACYVAALWSSMSMYRLCFHPLRHFPGPVMARLSKLWHLSKCTTSQNHLVMEGLSQRYGDFVRVGPSEIAIFKPEVVHIIDGPGNACTKSVWYDMMVPELSIVSVRDKKQHDTRRRIWEQGFSMKALAGYDDRVMEHVKKLERRIERASNNDTVVNGTSLMYFFGWDVMGDIVFGRSFNMLDADEWHVAIAMLKRAMSLLGPLTPVPWLAHIGFRFLRHCWIVRDWYTMINFCRERMQERAERYDGSEKTDVASLLIADARQNGFGKRDMHWLTGDSVLAIVAGSDTVTATLVCLFYRLAQDPSKADKLAQELQGTDPHDLKALQDMPYLNALLKETLRMYPALPTGGLRQTLAEGITIAGTYIPPYTTIAAPRYVLGRLESCFVRANEFIPERWTTETHMVKDLRAFIPFGVGRFNCIGKNLAWSELRLVTAVLVSKYHVLFAPGEDGHRVEAEFRDNFTGNPGRMDLVFKRRQ